MSLFTPPHTCLPGTPLVSFGDDGANAPKLDYNLPQSTEFEMFGRIMMDIDQNKFAPKDPPPPVTQTDVITSPTDQQDIMVKILTDYCQVYNFQDSPRQFVEYVQNQPYGGGCSAYPGMSTVNRSYLRKSPGGHVNEGPLDPVPNLDPGMLDRYEFIQVPGVILKVQRNVLRTSSVVVDALLGQGEALDCFNLRMQDAAAREAELANAKTELALNLVELGRGVEEKVTTYDTLLNPKCCPSQVCADCGPDSPDPDEPVKPHWFRVLSHGSPLQTVPVGGATNPIPFEVERFACTETLNFVVTGLPGGVTADAPGILAPALTSSVVLNVGSEVTPGVYPINITLAGCHTYYNFEYVLNITTV